MKTPGSCLLNADFLFSFEVKGSIFSKYVLLLLTLPAWEFKFKSGGEDLSTQAVCQK